MKQKSTARVRDLRARAVPILASNGFSRREIADMFGLNEIGHLHSRLFAMARDESRELAMVQAYTDGKTLEQIGVEHGLTRERVRQLLKRHDIDRSSGGISIASERRRQNAIRARDEKALAKWGCTAAEYQSLLEIQRGTSNYFRGPLAAYRQQRNSAYTRNIKWDLTLWQWWTIWQESGKWEQRGRGRGHYCMARLGDQGAYEIGNVKIIPNEENASESYDHSPADKRFGINRDDLGLTNTQRRIYDLAIHGLRNRDIASSLGVKPGTVASQLVVIRKLRPEVRGAA